MIKKILIGVGVVFVLLVIIGIFAGDPKQTTAPTTAAAPEAEAAPEAAAAPAVEVTADELLKAYKANEIAANEKFKDKAVKVTGTISEIGADFSDQPTITLNAGGEYEFSKPQAALAESDHAKAATLSKGQKVTLLCIGASEMAGTPMLKDCQIV